MIKTIHEKKKTNMKTNTRTLSLLTTAIVVVLAMHGLATHALAQETDFNQLAERALNGRAIEAVVWGMPAVNSQLMFDAAKKCGSDFNQIVYWSRPVTWKNQTLTPNPNTIYFFPTYNTKDVGPMVLEIPPADKEDSITGSVDDGWLRPPALQPQEQQPSRRCPGRRVRQAREVLSAVTGEQSAGDEVRGRN
jgi:hypothetical protein